MVQAWLQHQQRGGRGGNCRPPGRWKQGPQEDPAERNLPEWPLLMPHPWQVFRTKRVFITTQLTTLGKGHKALLNKRN